MAANFGLSFSLHVLSIFVHISGSIWPIRGSGHHWKDLLLQKLSIDDAKFGQKRWRQKWKKGQGSSWLVTAGMGVSGLKELLDSYSQNVATVPRVKFNTKIKAFSLVTLEMWQTFCKCTVQWLSNMRGSVWIWRCYFCWKYCFSSAESPNIHTRDIRVWPLTVLFLCTFWAASFQTMTLVFWTRLKMYYRNGDISKDWRLSVLTVINKVIQRFTEW